VEGQVGDLDWCATGFEGGTSEDAGKREANEEEGELHHDSLWEE
jgi:hypothetical protein